MSKWTTWDTSLPLPVVLEEWHRCFSDGAGLWILDTSQPDWTKGHGGWNDGVFFCRWSQNVIKLKTVFGVKKHLEIIEAHLVNLLCSVEIIQVCKGFSYRWAIWRIWILPFIFLPSYIPLQENIAVQLASKNCQPTKTSPRAQCLKKLHMPWNIHNETRSAPKLAELQQHPDLYLPRSVTHSMVEKGGLDVLKTKVCH